LLLWYLQLNISYVLVKISAVFIWYTNIYTDNLNDFDDLLLKIGATQTFRLYV